MEQTKQIIRILEEIVRAFKSIDKRLMKLETKDLEKKEK